MISFALALALTAAQPAPAPKTFDFQQTQGFWSRVAWHTPGAALDAVTTEVFLAAGARELHPLLQSRGVRLAVKAAEPLLCAWGEGLIERRFGRASAMAFRWTMITLRVALGVWNLHVAHRQARL